jgi:putative spermidine/putrescine transport system substrate-binding protein
MKLKTQHADDGAAAAGVADRQDMADSMTIVSWGGAYQASQINAYSEPYRP